MTLTADPRRIEALEELPDFGPVSINDLLLGNNQLLEELLAAVKHLTAAMTSASSDSRSSVELKVSSARTVPDPTVKIYAGSPVDGLVDTALETFGRLKREADERSLSGWAQTVNGLAEVRQ